MKKLMIATAVAAMIGGAYASTCVTQKTKICGETYTVTRAGTAHKVAISLKTTTLKGKTTKAQCEEASCIYWRQQTTKKINGLVWEQLDDCTGCVPFGKNCAFWTNDGSLDVDFAMGVGLIGKGTNSKQIEAYGYLFGDDFGTLAWAGFGSMAASTTKKQCEEDDCSMYVKSISGGIAGQLVPETWSDICQDCDAIAYDGCCDDMQLVKTAAYGTIKISYDNATAKKVAVAADDQVITSFYKLPAVVAADIDDYVKEVIIEE